MKECCRGLCIMICLQNWFREENKSFFLTNDYNSTYGKPKEVREALLRNLLKGIGRMFTSNPISGVSLDLISL